MKEWKHGGDVQRLAARSGQELSRLHDFSANINPNGYPQWLPEAIAEALPSLAHYPDYSCEGLKRAAASRYGVAMEEIVVGNGSSELLFVLPRALGHAAGLLAEPCYAEYERALARQCATLHRLPLTAEEGFKVDLLRFEERLAQLPEAATVILGHPNNPTGRTLPGESVRALARRHPRHSFVVDEAFGDFVEGFDSLTKDRPANVIVLLSLTKNFAIPGLRLGVAIAAPQTVERIEQELPPWTANTLALIVGERALKDADYIAESRRFVTERRGELLAGLRGVEGLEVFAGEANFLLLRVRHPQISARELQARLLRRGFAVRDCANFPGLPAGYLRLAVRRREENEALCRALAEELGQALL